MKQTEKYLNQIISLKNDINILNDEILQLETRITNTSKKLEIDVIQTTRKHDKQEMLIIKLIELKNEYINKLNNYEKLRNKIINEILEIEDPVYKKILYLRFVDGNNFNTISKKIHYSYRWTQTLYKRAIKEFKSKHTSSC